MSYIIIAAVCLLLGFSFGFIAVAFLSCNNNHEEELRQDLFLEQRRNFELQKVIKKLESKNNKYENTSNTL